jgi:uncharacterized protein
MSSAEPILPELTDVNRGFWEAAARGELAVQRCDECGHLRYPLAGVCPRCLSVRWAWSAVSGRATLFSWIVFHNGYHPAWKDRLPYNVALVELDEGPRLFSNLVGTDGTPLEIGMPLQVVFEPSGGITIPRFAPRNEGGETP